MTRKSFFKTLGLSVITSFLPISLLGYNRNNDDIIFPKEIICRTFDAECSKINDSHLKIKYFNFDKHENLELHQEHEETIDIRGYHSYKTLRNYIKINNKIKELKSIQFKTTGFVHFDNTGLKINQLITQIKLIDF